MILCSRVLEWSLTGGILPVDPMRVETIGNRLRQVVSEVTRQEPIRVVYFGTPAFAVPALRALHDDDRFDVVFVVTQPDRPAGRGRRLATSAVKSAALELDLPVYQPDRLRTEATRQPLVDAGADVFVVAAYGVIFGPRTLAIPSFGCLNLHASLLPAYRGASPISAAIAGREAVTGVTLMQMETGLDTGPILSMNAIDILRSDTTESLTARLATVGADLATSLIPDWVDGQIKALPQPNEATLTRPMTKADGWLDWSRPAAELEAQVRAMWPWPRTWTTLATSEGGSRILQVHQVSLLDDIDRNPMDALGSVLDVPGRLIVATGNGSLELVTVQEPGGRPIPGSVLISSGRLSPEGSLGEVGAPDVREPLVRPVED